MTNDNIATTALNATETATLDALLEVLIPADTERGLPSARGMPVPTRLGDLERTELRTVLANLQGESVARFDAAFTAAAPADRVAIVREVLEPTPFFRRLMHATLTVYYMDDAVMTYHGLAVRAPFPDGHDVVAGDFDLLAPVKARPPFFRPA